MKLTNKRRVFITLGVQKKIFGDLFSREFVKKEFIETVILWIEWNSDGVNIIRSIEI